MSGEVAAEYVPELVFGLDDGERRWSGLAVGDLADVLNVTVLGGTDMFVDAVSPDGWSQTRTALLERAGTLGEDVVARIADTPNAITGDALAIIRCTGGQLSVRLIETVREGGAAELSKVLSSHIGRDVTVTAGQTGRDVSEAYSHDRSFRDRADALFDWYMVAVGICSILSVAAGFPTPGIVFVLGALIKQTSVSSMSRAISPIPDGSMIRAAARFVSDMRLAGQVAQGTSAAWFLLRQRRKDPVRALLVSCLTLLSFALSLSYVPETFQALAGFLHANGAPASFF